MEQTDTRTPISAEARGLRRVWFAAASKRYAELIRVSEGKDVQSAARAFNRPATRMRSWLYLQRTLAPYATLESVNLKGHHPVAVWAAIRAGGDPAYRVGERALRLDEAAQEWAGVVYIGIGRLPNTRLVARGGWSIQMAAHAIGRLFERWRSVDVDAALLDLHHTLIGAPDASADELLRLPQGFVVPAGPGGWKCNAELVIPSVDRRTKILHIKAGSYRNSYMLPAEMFATAARLLTPQRGEPTLGQGRLQPWHLRPAPMLDPRIGHVADAPPPPHPTALAPL